VIRGFVAVALSLAPSVVSAQDAEGPPQVTRSTLSDRWLEKSLASIEARQLSPSRIGERDSLTNGAVIGAILGAAALGGFGLYLCHALDDTGGDPDCFPGVLGIAAVGAGIGIGAGVAIDVLAVRQAAPAALVRVAF
jgi:hypothetical protein